LFLLHYNIKINGFSGLKNRGATRNLQPAGP
jgi:hypothetical protein